MSFTYLMYSVTFSVLLLTAYPFAGQWSQTNGPWGAQVLDIASNDGTVFVTTDHGVFTTTDTGDNWKRSTTVTQAASTFLVKDGAVYAGTFHSLLVTNDNGKSWIDISGGLPDDFELHTLASKGTTIFAGFDDDPIYYSNDNGRTWTSTGQLMETFDLWVYKNGIFAATGEGLYRSMDDGTTWSMVDSGNLTTSFVAIGNVLLTGTASGLKRSLDCGATWELFGSGFPEHRENEPPAYDFVFVDTVLYSAAGQHGVYRSVDSGAHWLPSNEGLSGQYISTMTSCGSVIFAASPVRGVFRSIDNGIHWEITNRGLSDIHINDLFVDDKIIVAGCDGGISISYNSGTDWQWATISKNIYVASIIKKGNMFLAGTLGSGIYRSLDNGEQWSCIDSSIGWFKTLTIGNGGFFGIFNERLMFSDDSGATWVSRCSLEAVSLVSVNGDAVTIVASNRIYRSVDNGMSWVTPAIISPNSSSMPLSLVTSASAMYYGTTGGLYQWNEPGMRWVNNSKGIGDSCIQSMTAHDSTLFVGTQFHGVYLSTPNAINWSSTGDELSGVMVTDLAIGDTMLFAGTVGNGIWQCPLSTFENSNQTIHQKVIRGFTNEVRSPQSGNSRAVITFSLLKTEDVSVRIVDILGKEVAVITHAPHGPGSYRYIWNTAKFRSGCYFAQMRIGSNVSVGTISVVR